MKFILKLLFVFIFSILSGARAHATVSWWPYVIPPAGSEADAVILQHSVALLKRINIPADANVIQKADAIRLFVNAHSVHLIDEEFYSYWHSIPTLMTMIDRYADTIPPRKPQHDRPHMECASRSAVTYHLLRTAGINARFVVIRPDMSSGDSHTFLEIFNPDDKRWTILDPDANVFWLFDDGQRAGVADLLTHPVQKSFKSCRSPQDCGFDAYTTMFTPYFAFAALINPKDHNVSILYNPQRIDAHMVATYTSYQSAYCRLYAQGCRYALAAISNE